MAMHVGIVEFEFRLHGCRSLKEKRQVLRSLIDDLRHHFNASVAEVDHAALRITGSRFRG